MKLYKISLMLIGLFCFAMFQSCYYDDPPTLAQIDPSDISFSTHILPIFDRSCNTANCHDGTSEPNLLGSVAYQELIAGGHLNTVLPEESILYKSVAFEPGVEAMPPGGPQIGMQDIEIIRLWILSGAPNN